VALKRCFECGKEVSKTTLTCPRCGVYQHRKTTVTMMAIIVAPIVVLGLVMLGMIIFASVHYG
jgi:hypothetical protein